MKVSIIVVQGKPEGKVIPLTLPLFRVGRGETCHLRPSSEQVSREHAEFAVTPDKVTVRDLGSRNGTLVNGRAITEPTALKDRDLVQIGHLTFAMAIEGAPVPAAKAAAPAASSAPAKPAKPASPDDVDADDIDSWLVSNQEAPLPDTQSNVYGGDTITIKAFKDAETTKPKPTPAPEPAESYLPSDTEEYERLPEGTNATVDDDDYKPEVEETEEQAVVEELIDESNPFYVKKKAPEPEKAAKPAAMMNTSDAASEILKRMQAMKKKK